MQTQNVEYPGVELVSVIKSDSDVSNVYRQLYVGTAGDVSVETTSGVNVIFKNVSSGTVIGPFFIRKVKAATTASDIVGFI
jgi:hypothetical protein